MCIPPPIVVRQRLGKHIPAATNTRNDGIVGRVVFYADRVLSKESLGPSVYPSIVARERLCKHVSAASKNC
jgi:hypothetical protein